MLNYSLPLRPHNFFVPLPISLIMEIAPSQPNVSIHLSGEMPDFSITTTQPLWVLETTPHLAALPHYIFGCSLQLTPPTVRTLEDYKYGIGAAFSLGKKPEEPTTPSEVVAKNSETP